MKLILAQSNDGFFAAHDHDDMSWTGSTDKLLFKLLTSFADGPLLAGKTTFNLMPQLKGRELICLSRNTLSLENAYFEFPNAVLIGGPKIAEEALFNTFIDKFILVTTATILGHGVSSNSVLDLVDKHLPNVFSSQIENLQVTFMSNKGV